MISDRRLVAEVIALPLTSQDSDLRGSFVRLACSRGFSADQAEMLVGEAWSKGHQEPRSTFGRVEHLVHHADQMLRQDGSRLLVSAVGTGADDYETWRAVSLRVPSDVFVAAHAAKHLRGEPFTNLPSLMPPQLRRWAEGARLAETHLHLGAALGPLDVWLRLMEDPEDGRPADEVAQGPNALPGVDELYDAAFARIALAFVVDRRASPNPSELVKALSRTTNVPRDMARDALRDALLSSTPAPRTRRQRRLLQRVLRGFWTARGGLARSEPLDPVERVLGPSIVVAEVRLMARAMFWLLDHERSAKPPETRRAPLTWWTRWIAARCRFHQALTHEAGTPGLAWFQTFLARSRNAQGAVPRPLSKVLAHVGGESGLRALEVRFPPLPSPGENLRAVRSVAEGMNRNTELGIVFHFTTATPRPQRARAAPENLVLETCRRWLRENLVRARALGRLLDAYPESLALVRGVDLAGRELALPMWPRLLVLSEVRAAADRAAIKLRRRRPDWPPLTLRATHHVGEEFLSVTQGVRRIHTLLTATSTQGERGPLDSGALRVGDRLGHALVLGQCVDGFFEQRRVLRMPVAERLEDLLFELERYRTGVLECSAGRLAQIETDAKEASEVLFGAPRDLDELMVWRRALHDVGRVLSTGFMAARAGPLAENATLLERTLYDPGVLERGAKTLTVPDAPAERAATKALQQWVREFVSRRELTIEACPTSNLLVGDLPGLAKHPVLSLRQGKTPLSVSINTDNPLIHATRFEDELAFFHNALLAEGSSRKEADAALEDVVEAGWRSRFTSERTLETGTRNELRRLGRRA